MAIILTIGEGISGSNMIRTSVQSIFPNITQLAVANYYSIAEPDASVNPDVIMVGYPDDMEKSINLCQKLKENDRLKFTPILFIIPEQVDQAIQKRALEAGAEAFLSITANEFELEAQLNLMFKIKEADSRCSREQENGANMNHGDRYPDVSFSSNLSPKNEEKLQKVNRLYRLIRQISQSIVRTKEMEKLLPEICRIAVDQGEFRMAWIGFIDEKTKRVKPYSIAGVEDGYLSAINPISVSDIPEGRGPTGTALREEKHSVCNDYASDPQVIIWREEVRKRGYRSSIALPIRQGGAITGAFSLYSSVPYYFDEEEIDLLNEIASDISFALDTIDLEKKHQKALNALIESEEKYRCLTENMKDVVWVMDADSYRFTYVSPSVKQLRGYTPEEVISEPIEKTLVPQAVPKFKNIIAEKKAQFLEGKLPENYFYHTEEITQQCKDGTLVETEIVTSFFINSKTKRVELHGVTRNITERKRAEAEILKARERFQILFEQAPLGMAQINSLTGKIHDVNKRFIEITGYSRDELMKLAWQELTHPDDLKVGEELMDQFRNLEIQEYHLEKRYIKRDKSVIWISLTITHLQHEQNQIPYHLSIIEDITLRKRQEEDRKILLQAVEQTPASVVITDLNAQIQYVNPKFSEITGYSWEETIGKNPRILKSGDTTEEEYKKMWDTILSGKEWHGIFRNIKKNGESYFENAMISPVNDSSGKIIQFVAIKEDITERRKSELLIKTLSATVEQSPSMVVITNSNGEIEFVNQQFLKSLQYTSEEILGRMAWVFSPKHIDEQTSKAMWQTLKQGRVWKSELQNRKKDNTKFWEQVTVFPLNNEKGEVNNYIILMDDISEKKQLLDALVNAKNKAEESDRLKSAFLANMSHEIRTPLNSIIGFSELLLDPDFDQSQQSDFVYTIKQSGKNLLAIINNIMDISKLEAGQVSVHPESFCLNQLILDICSEYSRQVQEKSLELRINIPEKNICIKNDELKIKQILVNFVSNAIKFTTEGYIEIGFKSPEDSVEFYIKDSGIGIPAEFHDKIFERFRQVETSMIRQYGGNGLGLAISKQLARLMDGEVWMESELGKGSTFYLSLPTFQEN